MAKVSPIQNSFNAGELSPLLKGRIDLQSKYENGCEILENFIPMVHGPAQKRTGSRYVGEVKDSNDIVHIYPFQYSTTQAYVLEVGDQYIRFYKDGGRILETAVNISGATQANPVVITATSHGFNNGDFVYLASLGGMVEVNGMYFTVANVTTHTFELTGIDGTGYTAYTSGGTVSRVYEISTPYTGVQVQEIHYAQSADVMYISHPDHPPYKLARTDHDDWALTEVVFDWPPFNDENVDDTLTVIASATTGSGITLTASSALFTAEHVGGYFKIEEVSAAKYEPWITNKTIASGEIWRYGDNVYEGGNGTTRSNPPTHKEGTENDGGWLNNGVDWTFLHDGAGYVEITSFTSSTIVVCDVVKRLPESTLTPGSKKWSESAWSDEKGWPKTVIFYEDRLWFAGSDNKPQTLWASTSGDYENHKYGTNDDDALNYTINSQEVNTIEWLSSGKVLAIGTSGSEFIMSASSANGAITPTDVRIVPHTTYGSNREQPLKVGNAVLFIQRSHRKLREFVYTFDSDSYVAPNMNILADHVLDSGVHDLCYQQEPHQVVWVPCNDGVMAGMTYERSEEVVGWHRHVSTNGDYKSATTIPHWDGDQDVLWAVVERVIDGNTVKYVEYFEKYMIDDYSFFVDCGLTYDGASVTTISGLNHLEGQVVSILTDGTVHPDRTVTDGSITLQAEASVVNIGLPLTATLQTMPIEAGSQNGVAQGKVERINELVMRVHETGPGLFYGPDAEHLDEVHMRTDEHPMDEPVPLLTGDTERLPWPDGYTGQAAMTVSHSSPLPCTIVALMPQVTTYDR